MFYWGFIITRDLLCIYFKNQFSVTVILLVYENRQFIAIIKIVMAFTR